MGKAFWASVAIMAAAGAAAAKDRQFGSILYDPPPGWYEGRNDDGTLVYLSELPGDECEFCYIYLGAAEPLTGSLTTWARRNHARFVDEEDRAGTDLVGAPEAIGLAGRDAAIAMSHDGGDFNFLIAVAVGDQVVPIGFQGGAYDDETMAADIATFQSRVVPWLETLEFTEDPADGLLPPAEPQDFSGIYWGWWQSFVPDISGMMQMNIVHEVYVFYPDGHFYYGTPPTGTAPLDRAALLEAADTEFGIFEKKGRAYLLTFADGEQVEMTWNRSEDAWEIDDVALQAVTPLPDGTPLDGGISSLMFSGGGMIEGSASISAGSSTTFHSDGTYQGESFGGAFGSNFAVSSSRSDRGTYEVRDSLVIMRPSGGGAATAELAFRIEGEGILIGDRFLDTD